MVSVNQRQAAIRSPTIAYTLKILRILFGVMVVLSYAYWVFASFTTDKLQVVLMVMGPIVTMVLFVLGWLINQKYPGHTIALLFLIMAYSLAIGIIAEAAGFLNESLSPRYRDLIDTVTLTIGKIIWMPSLFFPAFLMPLYFPTGKLLSPRWRVLVIVMVGYLVWEAVAVSLRPWPWLAHGIEGTRPLNGIPGSEPFFDVIQNVVTSLMLPMVLLIPINMVLRYRRSQGVERIQMKWPLLAIVVLLLTMLIFWALPDLSAFDAELGYPIVWSVLMLFPISISIAILRHRLFDIDILINRTLVYGSLTALIVAMYLVIVGGLGTIFQTQASALGGLVAAGIIALLLQPLRVRLQRGVNRLLYGERDDPAIVLTRLAQQMETTDTPADILPNLVQTIARTLKIPHVAIWLPNDENQFEPVAVWGESPGHVEMIPLTYQNETIGRLVVAPRGPRESFNRNEQQLLNTIAALTANTVQAVQLSGELRRSRRRIVSAREDERRRLRRDLHDGLGPQLASQTLGLEAVAQLMPSNPEKAQALLNSLKIQAQEAMLDVRRLVYDLRPPALDDLGLVGALQQSVSRYATGALRFEFDMPQTLPELPAAVETAAYRIALEAMINVVRHAGATLCTVRLSCRDAHLMVEIRDNGRGLSQDHPSGVGLQAMKERATELNGQFLLELLPDGGTLVGARLPLEVQDE
jgi:signal transduction histidine kinase